MTTGMFTPDAVRALIKQSEIDFPQPHRARGETVASIEYDVAYGHALETAFDKHWSECSPIEKQVLLEGFAYRLPWRSFPEQREQVAKQVAAQHPESVHAIRKALNMPGPIPVRKSAPAARPLSPRAAATVRQIFEETASRQRAFEQATSAAYAAGRASVRKAKGETEQVAVYDENGDLVGVVDAEKITPLAAAKNPSKPQPAAQAQAAAQQAPAAPVDPNAVPAVKAMSLGVRAGTHQLGGPNPRGGVPVIPAEDAEADLQKALKKAAALRAQIGPNSGVPAAEQARIANGLQDTALAALSAVLNRR